MPLSSRNILVEMVARAGIEPATFRFSGGVGAYTLVFLLVTLVRVKRIDERPTESTVVKALLKRMHLSEEDLGGLLAS